MLNLNVFPKYRRQKVCNNFKVSFENISIKNQNSKLLQFSNVSPPRITCRMAATSGSNWSIVNRHSQRIDGVLHVNAPARKEFVVLCHGLLGTRNSILFPQLAQTLGEFNFVAFDFPLFKADNKSFRYGCYQVKQFFALCLLFLLIAFEKNRRMNCNVV